jgi:hypothetical protein
MGDILKRSDRGRPRSHKTVLGRTGVVSVCLRDRISLGQWHCERVMWRRSGTNKTNGVVGVGDMEGADDVIS